MQPIQTTLALLILAATMAACGGPAAAQAPTPAPATAAPLPTAVPPTAAPPTLAASPLPPTPTFVPTYTPAPTPTLAKDAWKEMPVIPHVSARTREIYQQGLALGNNPHAFSVVGDCQNVPTYFMYIYDDPSTYHLGKENEYLRPVIEQFAGSFGHKSQAVRRGFNVASVLTPLQADPKVCESGETPLTCELRLNKPSIAFVSMETWWAQEPATKYTLYMKKIIEQLIAAGVVPILATKADNLEGNHSINAAIAQIAYDYDIPLWNFWLAVQPLPRHGLTEDGFHLTFTQNFFDDPQMMLNAWPVRNLTALKTLDVVWRGVSSAAPANQP